MDYICINVIEAEYNENYISGVKIFGHLNIWPVQSSFRKLPSTKVNMPKPKHTFVCIQAVQK